MGVTDIRVQINWRDHPKRLRLQARLGAIGVLAWMDLWLWVGATCPSGNLGDMTPEEIAAAARYPGNPSEFVDLLCHLRMLDRDGSSHAIHDWKKHNGFAFGSVRRSEAGRKSAEKRWGNGSPIRSSHATPNAPSPSPSPVPSPVPSPSPITSREHLAEVASKAPPAAWPPELGEVKKTLEDLSAPLELFDPVFWRHIDAWLGPHPRIAYLAELEAAINWERIQPASKRKKSWRKFVNNWLKRAEEKDSNAEARKHFNRR